MSVSPEFRTFVMDQLNRVVPGVRDRAMFGGVGIYSGDLFFALIARDTLYLKAADSNRALFEARGMGPFRPYGPEGEVMQYYEVPADVLEDIDELRSWAESAVAVAQQKRRAGARRKPKDPDTKPKRRS